MYRRMIDRQTALGHHFLQITQPQIIRQAPTPHSRIAERSKWRPLNIAHPLRHQHTSLNRAYEGNLRQNLFCYWLQLGAAAARISKPQCSDHRQRHHDRRAYRIID